MGPRVPTPPPMSASQDRRRAGFGRLVTVARGPHSPSGPHSGLTGKTTRYLLWEVAGASDDRWHLGLSVLHEVPWQWCPILQGCKRRATGRQAWGGQHVRPRGALGQLCLPCPSREGSGRVISNTRTVGVGFTHRLSGSGLGQTSRQIATFPPCSSGAGFWGRAGAQKQRGPEARLRALVGQCSPNALNTR